jgi:hypothetical protein
MELGLDSKMADGGWEMISDEDLRKKWATDLILAALVDGSFFASRSNVPVLTNDGLGRLAAGRVSEDVILHIVEVYHGDYEISCRHLGALRKCGLGDRVIEAIVWKTLATGWS